MKLYEGTFMALSLGENMLTYIFFLSLQRHHYLRNDHRQVTFPDALPGRVPTPTTTADDPKRLVWLSRPRDAVPVNR